MPEPAEYDCILRWTIINEDSVRTYLGVDPQETPNNFMRFSITKHTANSDVWVVSLTGQTNQYGTLREPYSLHTETTLRVAKRWALYFYISRMPEVITRLARARMTGSALLTGLHEALGVSMYDRASRAMLDHGWVNNRMWVDAAGDLIAATMVARLATHRCHMGGCYTHSGRNTTAYRRMQEWAIANMPALFNAGRQSSSNYVVQMGVSCSNFFNTTSSDVIDHENASVLRSAWNNARQVRIAASRNTTGNESGLTQAPIAKPKVLPW